MNINKAIILLFIVFIIEIILNLFRKYTDVLFNIFKNKIVADLNLDISRSILQLEMNEFKTTSSGLFIDRTTHEPQEILYSFDAISGSIVDGISNLFIIIYISYLSPIMGIMILFAQLAIYIVEKKAINVYAENKKKSNKKSEKKVGLFAEIIKGIYDIKLLNLKNNIFLKTKKTTKDCCDIEIKLEKDGAKYVLIRRYLISIFTLIIVVLGIYFVKFNILSLAGLLTIILYRNDLFMFVLRFAWSEKNIRKFSISAKRIFDILDFEEFKKENYGNKNIKKLTGLIEFKNVNFGYDKDYEIIKNMNFKINPNDTVAIVGKSGEGKTTIFNLLTKICKIEEGKILFDNVNQEELTEKALRDNIAVITQNPYIFNMSIKENLKLVNNKILDKEIIKVCKICELDKFINTLPNKYNTILGEGGINLSGGQRQRLAIARALLMKTEIILFDEATSALDNETQKNIQDSINRISKDYTIIIIAHRLSTIKNCNRILVVDKGKIVGDDSHNNLLKNNKIYKKLYECEFK